MLAQNLTDTSSRLASFVGEPEHDVMVGLTASPPSLSGEALKNEFIDGVRRFLEERNRDIYRSLAQDLHEDDSSERLAVYWKARRERDTGNVSETP